MVFLKRFLQRNMSISTSRCAIFVARNHHEHSVFRLRCHWIYYIQSIKIIHLLLKITIKMDMKLTNTHQIIISKAGGYFPIDIVTILLIFQFYFFTRSVSATNIVQHDRCRHNKQSLRDTENKYRVCILWYLIRSTPGWTDM